MTKTNTHIFILSIFFLLLSAGFFSCSTDDNHETPTSGVLTVLSSEEIFPIMEIESIDFQRAYEKATLTHLSTTDRDAIVQLLNDSVKLIAVTRQFNEEEREVIKKNSLEVIETKVAYDGVAVIVNAENSLDQMLIGDIREVLQGKKKNWNSIPGSNKKSQIVPAMGDPNSGVYEFLLHKVMSITSMTAMMYPCSTSLQVIQFVEQTPNAIGFVGLAWASKLTEKSRIVKIGDPDFVKDSTKGKGEIEYFDPHQAHIYRNYYPLTRSIYLYGHNVGRGVAIGFTSFVASALGQSIFLKNNLVPATMPVRLVQLTQQ